MRMLKRHPGGCCDSVCTRTSPVAAGRSNEQPRVWLLPLSYNPLGKLLAAVVTQPYRYYPPRAWDEQALQRLVRLGYEIRQHHVAPADLAAFLRAQPQWSTHPADGRPFLWDAVTGELRVQTLSQHPPGWRFSIRIWQPPPAG